jgi:hypothetical protein
VVAALRAERDAALFDGLLAARFVDGAIGEELVGHR